MLHKFHQHCPGMPCARDLKSGFKMPTYTPLFNNDEKEDHESTTVLIRQYNPLYSLPLFIFTLLLTNLTTIVIFLAIFKPSCELSNGLYPAAQSNYEVPTEIRRFKGSFGLQSEFTGIGPEVDAAWNNITEAPTGGAIGITDSEWLESNSEGEFAVLVDEGVGHGKHLASFDVFHQLHCVDLLRKGIRRDYYDKHEGSFAGASEKIVHGHLEHCVEILRQTLMCHGDTSLLTYNWVKGREMPYPNFNTLHVCKDWDALVRMNRKLDVSRQWLGSSAVKEYRSPTKPKGLVGLKTPP
ncbi:Hypothetical protein R9X50_00557500 [Acrodontium crateriforme]|uniref:Uncharacterized protein n=1 Tax=Acrodontium crateriforme TaxID=150365 RepID=A0AAQ3M825_9PEZI|nr:Hypothetical protein R9X50_00557500 [Acrodontium crateriforme]